MAEDRRHPNTALVSVNYESIAADCDIIAQKIESLRKAIISDTSNRTQRIELELWKASNAIQEAKAAAT